MDSGFKAVRTRNVKVNTKHGKENKRGSVNGRIQLTSWKAYESENLDSIPLTVTRLSYSHGKGEMDSLLSSLEAVFCQRQKQDTITSGAGTREIRHEASTLLSKVTRTPNSVQCGGSLRRPVRDRTHRQCS
jgi:hypothetical protein